jgi:V-type H+-transporting ATPase subunit H
LFLAAAILRATPAGERESSVRGFLHHVRDVFAVSDLAQCRDLEFTVHAISVFVKVKHLRQRFLEAGLCKELPRTLQYVCVNEGSSMVQLMYEALLAVWILSYDYSCLAELAHEKLLPVVHKTLQRAIKEKCVRMGILILKNFSTAQAAYNDNQDGLEVSALVRGGGALGDKGPTFYSDMIGIGALKLLLQLQRKKYGDEDINKDLDALILVLETNLDDLTSFSEYKGEVESKVLEWSPAHTSSKFWKENCRKFESNGHEVLRNLVELLESQSDVTVAVACHDIGELVRYHPNGRMLLTLPVLGNPKPKIMHLMTHHNPEVARNALLAVQKIMVQKWEFLQ